MTVRAERPQAGSGGSYRGGAPERPAPAMEGKNSVLLIGYLTKEPELKYTPAGLAMYGASIALPVKRKVRDGADKWDTTTLRIKAFGKLAEQMGDTVGNEGQWLKVNGSIKNSSWVKQDGTKAFSTEIMVSGYEVVEPNAERRAPEPGDEPRPMRSVSAPVPRAAVARPAPEPEPEPEDDFPIHVDDENY